MTDRDAELTRLWMLAFDEPPPLIDAQLMERLLAEHMRQATKDPIS